MVAGPAGGRGFPELLVLDLADSGLPHASAADLGGPRPDRRRRRAAAGSRRAWSSPNPWFGNGDFSLLFPRRVFFCFVLFWEEEEDDGGRRGRRARGGWWNCKLVGGDGVLC